MRLAPCYCILDAMDRLGYNRVRESFGSAHLSDLLTQGIKTLGAPRCERSVGIVPLGRSVALSKAYRVSNALTGSWQPAGRRASNPRSRRNHAHLPGH